MRTNALWEDYTCINAKVNTGMEKVELVVQLRASYLKKT
jgi:hypothetical protein